MTGYPSTLPGWPQPFGVSCSPSAAFQSEPPRTGYVSDPIYSARPVISAALQQLRCLRTYPQGRDYGPPRCAAPTESQVALGDRTCP